LPVLFLGVENGHFVGTDGEISLAGVDLAEKEYGVPVFLGDHPVGFNGDRRGGFFGSMTRRNTGQKNNGCGCHSQGCLNSGKEEPHGFILGLLIKRRYGYFRIVFCKSLRP
jgi:hypothetical protein